MNMIVIVTGAAGFIGSSFVQALLAKGYIVYAIDYEKTLLENRFPSQSKNLIFIESNFDNYCYLHDFLPSNADFFVHFAWAGGLTSALSNYAVQLKNVNAACLAAEEATKLKVKNFIFISSNYQFMELNCNPSVNPNMYGIAKQTAQKMCESICYSSGMHFTSAILGNTFGPGDYSKKAVNSFIRSLVANEDLNLVVGDKPNDWMYIDETVNGLIAIMEENLSNLRAVYIGHKEISLFKDKLFEMKKILDSKSVLHFGAYPENSHVNYGRTTNICINQDYLKSKDFGSYILKTAEWIHQIDKR